MKRKLAAVMAAAMAISLTACGGGSNAPETTAAPAETTTAAAAAADTTAAPAETEAPTETAEMEDSLILYSSMTENDLNNLIDLFNEKYPDCEVEVVNGSAGELTARIAAEAGNPQGDLMWGGLSNSDGDTYSDIFEHWLSDYEGDVIADYKSNNGFYNLDHLSTCVFCINTELEKELGIEIKGYADLLDPKLEGKIVFSDPNSSSAAWNNVCNIMSVFGKDSDEAWDYMTKLMQNGLVVSTSSSVCFKSVETGEYVVGITYEDGASTLLKSGADNIRMVYPEEGTSASAFGCAVIQGAPHPNAAKAMVNFLMSEEGQNALGSALGTLRMTNSKANFESPYLPKTADVKWVTRDVDWMIENKEQVLEHWNQIYAEINK
ncbi:MAG: extracellular solute-binding protein [Lachnospiraceae bacterium]|jgi:iron(III) transport system substrate-binding protein|nr:extracellular solute-binding protein [Lachnospiraceae bacterium]